MAALSMTISRGIQKNSDVVAAVAVLLILAIMIIPLPVSVLDLLLAVNIATALAVLMVALYMTEPLRDHPVRGYHQRRRTDR